MRVGFWKPRRGLVEKALRVMLGKPVYIHDLTGIHWFIWGGLRVALLKWAVMLMVLPSGWAFVVSAKPPRVALEKISVEPVHSVRGEE